MKLDLVSGGPAWIATRRFALSAKVLPREGGQAINLSREQHQLLDQNLLAERFNLQAHVEFKELPIYELVIARGGSKLKTPAPEEWANFEPGHFQAESYPVTRLAGQISVIVHRTVIDKTGLTGNVAFDLKYTPDDQVMHAGGGNDNTADAKPDIFTALQEQLGLKLVPSKGPVKTLVIDHAEPPHHQLACSVDSLSSELRDDAWRSSKTLRPRGIADQALIVVSPFEVGTRQRQIDQVRSARGGARRVGAPNVACSPPFPAGARWKRFAFCSLS